MTPYKLITLFGIHKDFHPDRFAAEKPRELEHMDDIDAALGGF